uniref:RING-type E3 ubiquitin transferase n=1 Tax=Setaria italica TaxID=4555 RepID=K3YZA5_SETIT
MSYTFNMQPIVAAAKKKDARKDAADAAVRDCTPLSLRERGAGTAAVAVDGDRGSQYALKWAADHILSRGRPFFLIHVRRKPTSLHAPGGKQFAISHVQDDVSASFHAQMDLQAKDLMLPFQCFCSRRGLECCEVVLDGTDVAKAIVDFVARHKINKLVLGAACRNAFTRTIWKLDVPTSVTKSAPSFCSVYRNRPDVEPCTQSAIGPRHKPLTLDTSSSDSQHRERITEEFTDHDCQDITQPLLKRWPQIHSPREDRIRGSAPGEPHMLPLNLKALPKPIETKRMLECLPTRLECRIYTPDDIANATEHFSDELKIGEGGYGPVYKATLDNTLVAVKILYSNVTQGLKQFRQEVELLNNIRHPNMVHLVGACPEYGCLVYEYMPNGSLEDRLFCRSGTPPLPWQLRFRIAVEIAGGLLYLHKMKPEAFVHRDLKPGNILLDAGFVSKIGDVGLARIIPRSMDGAAATTQYRETAAAGTFCYIDPEYQKTGLVCTKSDVYALGVIYLQMVTGREPMGLAYTVSDALEGGTFADVLDGNVAGWPVQEARAFAELALKCCEMRRRDRPDLETVVMPELIRLHRLVSPSEYPSPSMDQLHHRSASEKELRLDDDLVDILSNGSVKGGASFAI